TKPLGPRSIPTGNLHGVLGPTVTTAVRVGVAVCTGADATGPHELRTITAMAGPKRRTDLLAIDPVMAKAEAAGVGEVGQSVGLAADTNRVQKPARSRIDDIDHAVIAAGGPELRSVGRDRKSTSEIQ